MLYVYLCCPICCVNYALERRYYDYRANGGRDGDGLASWHCPNGHSLVIKENELDRVRRERDRLQQQIAQRDDELRASRDQLTKARKKVAKLQRRAAAGVCPCCSRTFTNMARHMKTKHPDFKTAEIIDLKTG